MRCVRGHTVDRVIGAQSHQLTANSQKNSLGTLLCSWQRAGVAPLEHAQTAGSIVIDLRSDHMLSNGFGE